MLIEPFAAMKGVWDFDNPNVAIIDGFVVGPGDFWGRLEGGLTVLTAGAGMCAARLLGRRRRLRLLRLHPAGHRQRTAQLRLASARAASG